MATQKKIDQVKSLTQKLSKTRALYLADPSGIKHKQLEELRKSLKASEGEFTITKNALLGRALADGKKTISNDALQGATAALFAYADEVESISTLVKFFKTINLGKIKGGILGKQELTIAETERLATLPSKDMLLAKLVGQLQAPISGLHNALSWNIRKLVWSLEGIKTKKSV